MEKVLAAKHWQIFLMVFVLPFLCNIFFPSGNPFLVFKLAPLLIILFAGGYGLWIWAISIGLQKRVPSEVTLKVKKFKVFFIIPMVYMFFFSFIFAFPQHLDSTFENSPFLILQSMAIILPLHLFSMFCMFYTLYFASKTFKTVELQRQVTFSDFAGEFFLFWFFPVGVWVIQPKINKMIGDNNQPLV
ncbi:MAG: hypothetical protein Q8909_07895 [Bacteroidota bacterium]|nr:hypothetical protein [Bacteroidota bacterium]